MKKKSIRKRVQRLILLTALISVLVIGLVASSGILTLRGNVVGAYSELIDSVHVESGDAFMASAYNDIQKITTKKAELIDANWSAFRNTAIALSNSAEDIIQNPSYYNPRELDPDSLIWLVYHNVSPSDFEDESMRVSNMQNMLIDIVEENKLITAAYVGSELGYFIMADNGMGEVPSSFDPRGRLWYTMAKAKKTIIWTEPYEDAYGHGLMITCAAPFFDSEGDVAGVVGLDILLTDLYYLIGEDKSWNTEKSYLIGKANETIVSGGNPEGAVWSDIWQYLSKSNSSSISALSEKIANGETGVDTIRFTKTDGSQADYVIAYTMVETLPWKVLTLVSKSEIDEPIHPMVASLQALTDASLKRISSTIITILVFFAAIVAVIVILIGTSSQRFARSLTQPITELQDCVADIADGNLDHIIDIKTGDEIEDLSISVEKMAHDLKDYIKNLQTVTTEKERIGAELNVATKIQASMLPCIFPAFPDRAEFDIYASMLPAKEVGGDFYDFFLIDDSTLAVVIADVSGKGVPAALFMVIAKTLIKNNAQHGKSPKEVFETVNNLLCENNEANMFVTAFMGFLDIPSGKFTYVNAGHNPPLIRSGELYEWLPTRPGFVLAGMEDIFYKQGEITLKEGDELYMYTDGVTEAVNNEDELFGEPRLVETVNKYKGAQLKEFTTMIKREIAWFAEGAEQADDITMLALKYKGIDGGLNT